MKVLIIGLGKIGGYVAYSVLKNQAVQKLVIVGSNPLKTAGICRDLKDAYPMQNIEAASLDQIEGTFDLTILSFSSLKWSPAIDVNDRMIEARSNIRVLDEIQNKTGFDRLGTIVVVSNPVDILSTYIAREFKAVSVIGFGLSIDEKRITQTVNHLFGKSFSRVPCIGEHGLTITPLLSGLSLGQEPDEALYHRVKKASFESTSTIIKHASIPVYGPLSEIESLIQVILNKENAVISGSYFLEETLFGESGLAIGLPLRFERGIVKGHHLQEISTLETQLFKQSAEQIRQNYVNLAK